MTHSGITDPSPLLEGCDPWNCTDRAGGDHAPTCAPEGTAFTRYYDADGSQVGTGPSVPATAVVARYYDEDGSQLAARSLR